MKTVCTIGEGGCACGDYKSDNLIATTTCRKSGGSPDCSAGIAHLLEYELRTDEGLKEIGLIVEDMLGYGGDCVVVVRKEN